MLLSQDKDYEVWQNSVKELKSEKAMKKAIKKKFRELQDEHRNIKGKMATGNYSCIIIVVTIIELIILPSNSIDSEPLPIS